MSRAFILLQYESTDRNFEKGSCDGFSVPQLLSCSDGRAPSAETYLKLFCVHQQET